MGKMLNTAPLGENTLGDGCLKGRRARFWQFVWPGVGSVKMAFSRPPTSPH